MDCYQRTCTAIESEKIDGKSLPSRERYEIWGGGHRMTRFVESNDGWFTPAEYTRSGRRRAAFRRRREERKLFD